MKGKKLSLTEQGEHLRRALITIRDDETLLRKELREIAGRTKPLAIGATMTVGEYLLPLPLSRYIKAHPEKSLKLTLENTRRLRELLDSGDLDVAVVDRAFPQRRLRFPDLETAEIHPGCGSLPQIPGQKADHGRSVFRDAAAAGAGFRHPGDPDPVPGTLQL